MIKPHAATVSNGNHHNNLLSSSAESFPGTIVIWKPMQNGYVPINHCTLHPIHPSLHSGLWAVFANPTCRCAMKRETGWKPHNDGAKDALHVFNHCGRSQNTKKLISKVSSVGVPFAPPLCSWNPPPPGQVESCFMAVRHQRLVSGQQRTIGTFPQKAPVPAHRMGKWHAKHTARVQNLPWKCCALIGVLGGNVCPARTRRATFLLTIPTSAPHLPSNEEAPQVDHVALHTFPTKHVA